MTRDTRNIVLLALLCCTAGCASNIDCPQPCGELEECCASGYVCSLGKCVSTTPGYCTTSLECDRGMTCISNKCSCLTLDGTNYGMCDPNATCCATSGCVNLDSSHENCGLCGNTCSPNEGCQQGRCDASICNNGVKRCNATDTGVEMCMNGRWVNTDEVCMGSQTCRNAQCVTEKCSNGSFRCRNDNVEWCVNNEYTLYSECTKPKVCDEDTFQCTQPPECESNEKRCSEDGNIKQCVNNVWRQIQSCSKGTVCNHSTLTCTDAAECISGLRSCNGIDLKVCNNGAWSTQACPDGELCDNGACVKRTCIDDDRICYQDPSTKLHQIMVCQNNLYNHEKTCMSGEICVSEGKRASCQSQTCEKPTKCEKNVLYACNVTEYVKVAECKDNEYCDESKGKCMPNCGNNIVDSGEECDGASIPETCSTMFGATYGGELTCSSSCNIITTNCKDTVTGGSTGGGGSEVGPPPPATASDYLITFDDFGSDVSIDYQTVYTTPNKFTHNGVQWDIVSRTIVDGEQAIDNQGIIFSSVKTNQHATATNITNGISTLSFQYRSWGKSNDNGTILVTVTAGDGSVVTEIFPYKKDDSPLLTTATLNVNKTSIKSIEIKTDKASVSSNGRVIIDNIGWKILK